MWHAAILELWPALMKVLVYGAGILLYSLSSDQSRTSLWTRSSLERSLLYDVVFPASDSAYFGLLAGTFLPPGTWAKAFYSAPPLQLLNNRWPFLFYLIMESVLVIIPMLFSPFAQLYAEFQDHAQKLGIWRFFAPLHRLIGLPLNAAKPSILTHCLWGLLGHAGLDTLKTPWSIVVLRLCFHLFRALWKLRPVGALWNLRQFATRRHGFLRQRKKRFTAPALVQIRDGSWLEVLAPRKNGRAAWLREIREIRGAGPRPTAPGKKTRRSAFSGTKFRKDGDKVVVVKTPAPTRDETPSSPDNWGTKAVAAARKKQAAAKKKATRDTNKFLGKSAPKPKKAPGPPSKRGRIPNAAKEAVLQGDGVAKQASFLSGFVEKAAPAPALDRSGASSPTTTPGGSDFLPPAMLELIQKTGLRRLTSRFVNSKGYKAAKDFFLEAGLALLDNAGGGDCGPHALFQALRATDEG
jgi:hypothetical protein